MHFVCRTAVNDDGSEQREWVAKALFETNQKRIENRTIQKSQTETKSNEYRERIMKKKQQVSQHRDTRSTELVVYLIYFFLCTDTWTEIYLLAIRFHLCSRHSIAC